MSHKILAIFIICLQLTSCAELQSVLSSIPQNSKSIGNKEIALGLKEALDLGIEKQVSKLTEKDGFYRNEMVKIMLPEELQKVDETMRKIGLGSVADEGLKLINRAAEDAVKEATPIFIDAVKEITFTDALTILKGDNNAATNYLTSKTQVALYDKFNPIIKQSFQKVGADEIWKNIINRYNNIPFTTDINPDLTDYVTNETLKGVYTMIALEEQEIRTKYSARSTELLKKVFALQD